MTEPESDIGKDIKTISNDVASQPESVENDEREADNDSICYKFYSL